LPKTNIQIGSEIPGPITPESLDAEQYAALTAYRTQLGQDSLYFKYEDLAQLRMLLQSHIAGLMSQIHVDEHPSAPINHKQEPIDIFVSQYQSFVRR
jgi:hypothetical protein